MIFFLLLLMPFTKKRSYKLCIFALYSEWERIIELNHVLELRERDICRKPVFCVWGNAFFCIRMRCVSCTKIAFRVFFVVVAICLFCSMPVVCSVRHTLEISLKKATTKNVLTLFTDKKHETFHKILSETKKY